MPIRPIPRRRRSGVPEGAGKGTGDIRPRGARTAPRRRRVATGPLFRDCLAPSCGPRRRLAVRHAGFSFVSAAGMRGGIEKRLCAGFENSVLEHSLSCLAARGSSGGGTSVSGAEPASAGALPRCLCPGPVQGSGVERPRRGLEGAGRGVPNPVRMWSTSSIPRCATGSSRRARR